MTIKLPLQEYDIWALVNEKMSSFMDWILWLSCSSNESCAGTSLTMLLPSLTMISSFSHLLVYSPQVIRRLGELGVQWSDFVCLSVLHSPHYSQESSVRRVRRRKFSHLTGLYHKTRCYHDLKLLLLITQNAWLLALAYDSSPPGLNPRPKLWGSDCDHLNLCLHKVLREQ